MSKRKRDKKQERAADASAEKMPRKVFDKELRKLQVELCHLGKRRRRMAGTPETLSFAHEVTRRF